MKLAELQRIKDHLQNFTIDDFYLNEDKVYNEIRELMGFESDENLEEFLNDSVQKMVNKLNSVLDMSPLNEEIANCLKSKERLESEITDKKQSLDELDKQFESIPSTENSLKKEIKDIEEEILQIQPLSEKEPYSSRIEELKVKKSDTANKMETLAEEIKNKKQNLLGEIELKESEIQDCENEIKELEQSKQTNQEMFLEFDVLVLLCKILLDKKVEIFGRYGTYYDERILNIGDDENIEKYFYRIKTENVRKISVNFNSVNNSLFYFLNSIAISIVPRDWKKELSKFLNSSLPFDSGFSSISLEPDSNITRSDTIDDETKGLILSTLLSIKQSLENNHQSLSTANKSIFLALTGGIMAEIKFREKGKTLEEIKEPVFYLIRLDEKIRRDITLYSQSGYGGDNTINLKIINGFYIIALDYVLEILLKPAPILFESNQCVRNVSVPYIDDDD
ncbi:hypothetical protein [Candidatus Parabeggiatoa sp. HSG14]|uniref:hypothetical protein n=1 Tax=Candidatus Parabeggiatoa sp. HSG14 TaxID=3055593 RepID=UPI0025A72834|nr:hypothetical protein [Thiotrichales bacterium HSG14]